MIRSVALYSGGLLALVTPVAAYAQSESVLLDPSIPPGFDAGRNVSVTQKPRPDYDAIGIPVGAFNVFPTMAAGVGYTNNVYLSSDDIRTDGYAYAAPNVRVVSDWSRHFLQVRAQGQFKRFFDETLRNETEWGFGGLGRLDVGSDYALTGEVQLAKQFESPFNGEVGAQDTALSKYQRDFFNIRGEYRAGQIRAVLAADTTNLDFNPITFLDGSVDPQDDRDRRISRVTGQIQYALTPSAGFYGQASYGKTDYRTRLANGDDNRDSKGLRVIGGLNFDLAGFLRGNVGVGYIWREYDSPLYRDVQGFSAEAKIEYFFSELTTVTLAGRRVIEDSSLGASNAFFDNRLTFRVDHELLNNLILNTQFDLAHQDYIGSPQTSDIYRIAGGARYFSSNTLGLDLQIAYAKRDSNTVAAGRSYNEFRVQFGIVAQR